MVIKEQTNKEAKMHARNAESTRIKTATAEHQSKEAAGCSQEDQEHRTARPQKDSA